RNPPPDKHPGRVMPEEERLIRFGSAIEEVQRVIQEIVLNGLHPLFRQWTGVLDGLLADAAKARIDRRIVVIRGLAVEHPTGEEELFEGRMILRVVRLLRLLLGVEVIQVAVELVESMKGGQEFVPITEVILPDLSGHVPQRLEQFGERRILGMEALRRSRQA